MANEYLIIKNWDKWQALKGDKPVAWIKDYCDKDGDRDYGKLTGFQRYVLDALCRLIGRTHAHRVHNDPAWLARAIQLIPTERAHMVHTIRTLIAHGFLVLCNQQNAPVEIEIEVYKEEKEREKEIEETAKSVFAKGSFESGASQGDETVSPVSTELPVVESVPAELPVTGLPAATPIVFDTMTPGLLAVDPDLLAETVIQASKVLPLSWDGLMLAELREAVSEMLAAGATQNTIVRLISAGKQHFQATGKAVSLAIIQQVGWRLVPHQCPVTTCRAVWKIDRNAVVRGSHPCPACGFGCLVTASRLGAAPVTPDRVAELKRFVDDYVRRVALEATPEYQAERAEHDRLAVVKHQRATAWAEGIKERVVTALESGSEEPDSPLYNPDSIRGVSALFETGLTDQQVIDLFVEKERAAYA